MTTKKTTTAPRKKPAAKKAAKKSTAKKPTASAAPTARKARPGNGAGASKKTSATSPPAKSRSAKTPRGKQRATLIQQTAYFIAEKRGFQGGDPVQDWLAAEKQVDKMLNQNQG